MAVTVALTGCSSTGKTTLALHLKRLLPALIVVHADDYFLPPARCPRVDLAALPWPSGKVPQAFAARGNADYNVPGSLNWEALHSDVMCAHGSGPGPVLVEGQLLLSSHSSAERLRGLIDHTVVLAPADDAEAMEKLWQRKWRRAHLGKPSYKLRGVSADAYAVYWHHYVWQRWLEHGEQRVPGGTLRLECQQPVEALADAVRETGWLETQCRQETG